MNTEALNSKAYWDQRFDTDWAELQGREQSRFFARLAVENLPGWFKRLAVSKKLTFCDWGCAEGDGTDVLASFFGRDHLSGVDFSEKAVEKAQRNYGDLAFKAEDWLTANGTATRYDVVFSSNTLEHFQRPYEVLARIAEYADKFIVLLLPYREFDRHPEHYHTFISENIPFLPSADFVLVHARAVDTRAIKPTYWAGEQVVLIYARRQWLESCDLTLDDIQIGNQALLYEVKQLKTLNDALTETVAERDSCIEFLNKAVTEREGQITGLNQAVAEREGQIVGLNQAVAEQEEQIDVLTQEMAEKDNHIESLFQSIVERNSNITELINTRSWRLTRPLRFAMRIVRFRGLTSSDREHLQKGLRKIYHALPLSQRFSQLTQNIFFRTHYRKHKTGHEQGQRLVLIQEIATRIELSRGAIVFAPSIGWNVPLFQRPHHLARVFAQMGYISIFDVSNANDPVEGFLEIEPNLFLYRGEASSLAALPNVILWTFTYNYDYRDQFPEAKVVIYDWIDDLTVFPHDQRWLAGLHERALKEATIVACVAKKLLEQARQVRLDAVYLQNGVEYERFAMVEGTAEIPHDPAANAFLSKPGPLAGYYGALADWFDYDLLADVAQRRPNWRFLLIGPDYDGSIHRSRLKRYPNVLWIGPRDYATLPYYLAHFDVAIIPFAINEITNATSPLKLYEYLAGGKPVVTTPMPECLQYPEVFIGKDAVEFAEHLDTAATSGKDMARRKKLQALGRQNSWQSRAEVVVARLESIANPTTLTSPTLPLAERFVHFKTDNNVHFFDALTRHFAWCADDPYVAMHFAFAISANTRGKAVVELLAKHTSIHGKRALDVGCAYGGFLVALFQAGADVSGIEIEPNLIELCYENLRDVGISPVVVQGDATRPETCEPLEGPFDILTCNDVIEHVLDPDALIANVSRVMAPGGIAYFEIPNFEAVTAVLSDGHYQLFGITLLDRSQALTYFEAVKPGVPYGVSYYFTLSQYLEMFQGKGLIVEILEETLLGVDHCGLHSELQRLKNCASEFVETAPEAVREVLAKVVSDYLTEARQAALDTSGRDFLLRFGVPFWKLLVRKPSTMSLVGEGNI